MFMHYLLQITYNRWRIQCQLEHVLTIRVHPRILNNGLYDTGRKSQVSFRVGWLSQTHFINYFNFSTQNTPILNNFQLHLAICYHSILSLLRPCMLWGFSLLCQCTQLLEYRQGSVVLKLIIHSQLCLSQYRADRTSGANKVMKS